MKILKLTLMAATIAGSLTVAAAPAAAQRGDRWHNGNGHHWGHRNRWRRVCQWRWRHHHRVRVCWRTRW